MSNSHISLTIKDFIEAGDWRTEVGSFAFISQGRGPAQVTKLSINRRPDQYSNRFAVLAYLRHKNRDHNLVFPRATLTVDRYAANGALISRSTYDFCEFKVEGHIEYDRVEAISFTFNKLIESVTPNVETQPMPAACFQARQWSS